MKKTLSALATALPTLALVIGASTSPVAAQSGMDDLVRMQLDSASAMMGAEGFALERDYRSGWLRDGASEALSLPLLGNRSYVIVGVCDADCSDMDLALATESGTDVDSDYELDDFPLVMTETTGGGGMYLLTVSMPGCSIEPCGYGVAVFAREE